MIKFILIAASCYIMVLGINDFILYATEFIVGPINSDQLGYLIITLFVDFKIYSAFFEYFYPNELTAK